MPSQYSTKERFINFMQKIVLLHLVLFFMRWIYFFLEIPFRKNKKIALFFLTEKYYYDNSRYLFEYMRKKEDFNSILFTANKNLYRELKEKFPNQVVFALSVKGFFLFLRSKHVILSYGNSAAVFAPYYLHEKWKNIIYLGHGTPMKKFGLQAPAWRKYGKARQMQKYSYMVGSSQLEKIIHAAGFNMDMCNVWATGLPRNDYLLQAENKNAELLSKYPFLDHRVILYAPTWREDGHKTQFFPFEDFDAQKLSDFLEKNDAYLLIRGHKEDIKRKTISKNKDFSSVERVIKADQDYFDDVYQLLPFVDLLITDYSSLWIDYLLLDRPIVFLPYDLEEYKQYKGFFIDFEEHTPGAKADTFKEFTSCLQEYFDQPEKDQQCREKIRNLYHLHQDANSCERVYTEIQKLNHE